MKCRWGQLLEGGGATASNDWTAQPLIGTLPSWNRHRHCVVRRSREVEWRAEYHEGEGQGEGGVGAYVTEREKERGDTEEMSGKQRDAVQCGWQYGRGGQRPPPLPPPELTQSSDMPRSSHSLSAAAQMSMSVSLRWNSRLISAAISSAAAAARSTQRTAH